jgi:hypothetical protein
MSAISSTGVSCLHGKIARWPLNGILILLKMALLITPTTGFFWMFWRAGVAKTAKETKM